MGSDERGLNLLSGGPGNDRLGGSSGRDSITGGAGDDVLVGGGNSDLRTDQLLGEGGNDRLIATMPERSQDSARLSGGPGDDALVVSPSRNQGFGDDVCVSYAPSIHGFLWISRRDQRLAKSTTVSLASAAFSGRDSQTAFRAHHDPTSFTEAEVQTPSPEWVTANSLYGDGGTDIVDVGSSCPQNANFGAGGRGSDSVVGGPGNDRLEGGPGTDSIDAGDGQDSAICGDHVLGDTCVNSEQTQQCEFF